MIRPANLPLRGGRWEPFVYTIDMPGVDLTGATLGMQVRQYPDQPGAPLVSLEQVPPPAQGITFSVLNGTSTIKIRINETTMEGLLPLSANPDREPGDIELHYDIQVARPGVHEKARYFRGTFTVEAGVTQ
jgi:hypothetical protein